MSAWVGDGNPSLRWSPWWLHSISVVPFITSGSFLMHQCWAEVSTGLLCRSQSIFSAPLLPDVCFFSSLRLCPSRSSSFASSGFSGFLYDRRQLLHRPFLHRLKTVPEVSSGAFVVTVSLAPFFMDPSALIHNKQCSDILVVVSRQSFVWSESYVWLGAPLH